MTWTDHEVDVLMDTGAALASSATVACCAMAGWKWALVVPVFLVARAVLTSRTATAPEQPTDSLPDAKGQGNAT